MEKGKICVNMGKKIQSKMNQVCTDCPLQWVEVVYSDVATSGQMV